MLLSLILPQTDEGWLDGFSRGLGALAEIHRVALIGGNLSGGPLSVTVTLMGESRADRRCGGTAHAPLTCCGSAELWETPRWRVAAAA